MGTARGGGTGARGVTPMAMDASTSITGLAAANTCWSHESPPLRGRALCAYRSYFCGRPSMVTEPAVQRSPCNSMCVADRPLTTVGLDAAGFGPSLLTWAGGPELQNRCRVTLWLWGSIPCATATRRRGPLPVAGRRQQADHQKLGVLARLPDSQYLTSLRCHPAQ